MVTLSPDRLSLLLFNRKPIQLNTRSAWVFVAGTHGNFLASLTSVGYCFFLLLHQPKGSLPTIPENGQNDHFQACRQRSPRVAKGLQGSRGTPGLGWSKLLSRNNLLNAKYVLVLVPMFNLCSVLCLHKKWYFNLF